MMSSHRFVISVCLFTCLIYAQVDRANLNGTVTDMSGAVAPQTKVELISRDTGLKRLAKTGPTGSYNISGLPIGTYDLRFSREGFRTIEAPGIQLFVGQTRTVIAIAIARPPAAQSRAFKAGQNLHPPHHPYFDAM